MRLLHARHADHAACAADRRALRRGGAHPRGAVGQYLPLHRLCADRRGGARGAPILSGDASRAGAVMRPNTQIGSPVERVEDARFLTGDGRYVDDLDYPGQWHAAFLRSPVAHGRVIAIDCSKALAMPEVRAVLTAADMARPIPTIPFRRPNPTIAPYAQPIIAGERVRYVGEPLAMVLADSAEAAEDAAAEIAVDLA